MTGTFKRADKIPLGIALMVGATVMFGISQAISKWQVAHFSVVEVLSYRAIGSLAAAAALILPRTGLAVFRTQRLREHFARNGTQCAAQTSLMIAFSMMPLAGAVAINFSSPLFATLFAALWLKEKVGWARGMALVTGFLGVLLVASPGADSFRLGALFALGNAVLFGSVTAAVRGLSKTESADTLTMFQVLILAVAFTLPLPFFFTTPTWFDLLLLLGSGVVNGIGQYWWTHSLSMAPPAAVGPFFYTSLVWAMLLGFVIWGDIPTLGLLAGSAIVVATGIFLLWHESAKKARLLEEAMTAE
ncbi:MAG TPA: DMT family transporter [Pseudolabrys sp.]|jgi:drug/metabolite transporter (DMT)-like permease